MIHDTRLADSGSAEYRAAIGFARLSTVEVTSREQVNTLAKSRVENDQFVGIRNTLACR
jgi:hypothetical protein